MGNGELPARQFFIPHSAFYRITLGKSIFFSLIL